MSKSSGTRVGPCEIVALLGRGRDGRRVSRPRRKVGPRRGMLQGLEESGAVGVLVMELVEGPTLAERIAQGPIPLDEALPIARQTAAELEAAHERGIIHRDLKPANIKLRPDGAVKALDSGLAKAWTKIRWCRVPPTHRR